MLLYRVSTSNMGYLYIAAPSAAKVMEMLSIAYPDTGMLEMTLLTGTLMIWTKEK